MKNSLGIALRTLFLLALLWVNPAAKAINPFSLSPLSVSNTYTGTLQCTVGSVTPGHSVVVQKFLDLNSNGVVDSTDLLVQQFKLTDGQPGMVINQITNFDVPGDTDGSADGTITATLRFNNGDFSQIITGQYIYVVSSGGSQFTRTLQVTNVPYSQSIVGTVTNTSGAPVPNAVVLLFPPPRQGDHGPGNPTAGAIADSSGKYTIPVPPGSYTPVPFASNYVGDFKSAVTVTVGTNATVTNNLSMTVATRTISGTLVDATNSGIVLPGVFQPTSANGKVAIGFSDTNGLLTLRVTSDTNWDLGTDDKGLFVHGYVGYNNGTNVDTSGGDVTGQTFPFYRATALFYGTVLTATSNALVGVDISDNDSSSEFSMDAYTDANGNYVLDAVGGLGTNDTWTIQTGNDTYTNYIFSQPDFTQNGGTNINAGQAILGNIIGIIPTNTITGHVSFNGTNVVGVAITSYGTINGVTFNLNTVDTDGSGNYSIPAGIGNWNVSVSCQNYQGGISSTDNLDSILGAGTYQCPNNTNITISTSNIVANFVVQGYSVYLSGRVTDDHSNPVTNMDVFATPTNGGGSFQATTDSSGNFLMGLDGGSYTVQLNNDPVYGYPALGLVGPNIPITVTNGINVTNFLVIAPQVTGAIQVQVLNPTNGGVFGIGTFASLTNGITNYATGGAEVQTDSNGVATLSVFNGTWQVSVNNNDVQNAGFITPANQFTTITNSTNTVTFNLAGGGFGGPLQAFQLSQSNGLVNAPFNSQFLISGGDPFGGSIPYLVQITNGSYPPGISPSQGPTNNNSSTYILSGTPTTNGVFTFSEIVSDSVGDEVTNTYTITIDPSFNVSLNASPVNGGSANGGGYYASNAFVSVTASNNAGFVFQNWTSNSVVVSTNTTYGFNITTNLSLTANFVPAFTVTATASPTNGGGVTGNNVSYPSNSLATVTATPNAGFVFTKWTSGGQQVSASTNFQFTITSDTNLVANFSPVYTYTVVLSPTNGGTASPGASNVLGGSPITVTATNNPGFAFAYWTSNGTQVAATTNFSFNLNTNVTLIAHFLPVYNFTTSANPLAGGTVSPGGSNYQGAPAITLFATNNPGYIFTNWTSNGVIVATTTNFTFQISTNVAFVANFLPVFDYTTAVNPAGAGTVSAGASNIVSNSVVTLNATNNPGYAFTNWTSNSVQVSTSTNYSFNLTTNDALTANFNLLPGAIEVFHGTNLLTNNQTNAVAFPFVEVTQPGPIVNFVVTNAGGAPLTVSNISVPTNFVLLTNAPATLTNFPAVLSGITNGAATNEVFSVQLLASNAGTYTGNIVITNDDTNFTFAISGTVSPSAPAIAVLDGTNAIANNQSTAVHVGTAILGQAGVTKVFTITNQGLQTLNVSNISVPAGYTLTTNAPASVAAGTNASFSIQLDTGVAGTISGNVVITNNDTNNNPFTFPITGFVASKIISVSGSLAFGVVPLNTVSNLSFVISNLGSTNLTVTNITFPAGFSVSTNSGVIASGGSQTITVSFSPTAATNYGGVITVASDGSGNNVLAVSGFGEPASLSLKVITNGAGTVEPILTAKALVAGRKYTLTATAKAGNVFSNWTGSVVTNKNPLTFTMEPGTILEANFVTNPFLPTKGTYNGLFSATNGQITEQTAGMLKGLMLGTKGTYSGTLLVNGSGHGLTGTFNLAGQATNKITRSATQGGNLVVVLTLLNPGNAAPYITGTITASNWVSTNLMADLASNVSFSSQYTLAIPPDTNSAVSNVPSGDGYALITNHSGAVKITGALADGTAFNQSVPASQAGDVPVYASLYGNKGMLIGWINLNPTNAGTLNWVHPTAKAGLFQSAFTTTNPIELSGWTNPPVGANLPTNVVMLTYTNGAITQSNAFVIVVSNNYKLGEISGPEPLSGTLNPKTGQLSLSIGPAGHKVAATAVVLPEGTNGGGYFVTKTNAGAILLKP